MKPRKPDIRYLLAAMFLALAFAAAGYAEVDATDEEVEKRITTKVIVHCEEGEDCAEGIHIEMPGHLSDVEHSGHKMIWIGDRSHGDHFAVHSSLLGKGGYLGVQLAGLTPELRSHFGVPDDAGVMVAKVLDDTAAFRSGLAAGDIITRVDGETVTSPRELATTIRQREEGETINLEIWRDGSMESIAATLEEHDSFGLAKHTVVVKCGEDDEGCDCTVNGEIVDCEQLHKEHHQEN